MSLISSPSPLVSPKGSCHWDEAAHKRLSRLTDILLALSQEISWRYSSRCFDACRRSSSFFGTLEGQPLDEDCEKDLPGLKDVVCGEHVLSFQENISAKFGNLTAKQIDPDCETNFNHDVPLSELICRPKPRPIQLFDLIPDILLIIWDYLEEYEVYPLGQTCHAARKFIHQRDWRSYVANLDVLPKRQFLWAVTKYDMSLWYCDLCARVHTGSDKDFECEWTLDYPHPLQHEPGYEEDRRFSLEWVHFEDWAAGYRPNMRNLHLALKLQWLQDSGYETDRTLEIHDFLAPYATVGQSQFYLGVIWSFQVLPRIIRGHCIIHGRWSIFKPGKAIQVEELAGVKLCRHQDLRHGMSELGERVLTSFGWHARSHLMNPDVLSGKSHRSCLAYCEICRMDMNLVARIGEVSIYTWQDMGRFEMPRKSPPERVSAPLVVTNRDMDDYRWRYYDPSPGFARRLWLDPDTAHIEGNPREHVAYWHD